MKRMMKNLVNEIREGFVGMNEALKQRCEV